MNQAPTGRFHPAPRFNRFQTSAREHWPVIVLLAILLGRALYKLAILIAAHRGGAL